jgi:hypothetical protein
MTILAEHSSLRSVRSLALPQAPQTDDRARFAASSPAQAVQAAARAIARNTLQPVCSPVAGVAFHPRALLALLTYCYVSEVFASTDIEELMRSDAGFRATCGNQIPDARTLRRFRRNNHEAIEICLHSVLRWMANERGRHPSDAEIHDRAKELLNTAMLMDMNEDEI